MRQDLTHQYRIGKMATATSVVSPRQSIAVLNKARRIQTTAKTTLTKLSTEKVVSGAMSPAKKVKRNLSLASGKQHKSILRKEKLAEAMTRI